MSKYIVAVLLILGAMVSGAIGFNEYVYNVGKEHGYNYGYIKSMEEAYYSSWGDGYYVKGMDYLIDDLPATFGYTYIPKRVVTLAELKLFLERDKTDRFDIAKDFNCLGYAFTLKANADREGLLAGVVTVYFSKEIGSSNTSTLYRWNAGNITTVDSSIGHALNAFCIVWPKDTINNIPEYRTIVFVEPQTDTVVRALNIGKSYSSQVYGWYHMNWWGARSMDGLYLKDDIVRNINIFWGKGYENMLDYGKTNE